MNLKLKVSIAVPPPTPSFGGVMCWERSEDPFHADAFEGVFPKNKSWFSSVKERIIFIGGGEPATGKRASGWMGICGVGNPIGFIADGTDIEHYDYEYILAESYPGRLCAVPNNESSIVYFRKMNEYLGYNQDGTKKE